MLLFFERAGNHRDLHSFPTRRSSDLMLAEAAREANIPYIMSGASNASIEAAAKIRSEEHTSELQSRRDLVCRLLLEKKKKNKLNKTLLNSVKKYTSSVSRYSDHLLAV